MGRGSRGEGVVGVEGDFEIPLFFVFYNIKKPEINN